MNISTTIHSQSWRTSGTHRRLLTPRSKCQTGGPRSSPSHRAALGTQQTWKKQNKITSRVTVAPQGQLDPRNEEWCLDRQLHSRHSSSRRTSTTLLLTDVCLRLETHCKGAEREGRNTKLLTMAPLKVISVPLQQCVSATSCVFAVVSQTHAAHRRSLCTVARRKLPSERCGADERCVCPRSH